MLGTTELFITLIPMAITLIVVVFSLSLLMRFVRAVEKIADKFDGK